jgi:hypothetical protein
MAAPPAMVIAVSLASGLREWPLVLGYRPPRTTTLLPLTSAEPAQAAATVRAMAREDATVVLVDRRGRERARHTRELLRLLPDRDVLGCDPEQALRFLWFYRDGYDPLALGHAGTRRLLDPTYLTREIPDLRSTRRKKERSRTEKALRLLVREIGAGLGISPPLPPAAPAEDGWSPVRLAVLYDALAGLYAAALRRWGSKLAVVREREAEAPMLTLEDSWLREQSTT